MTRYCVVTHEKFKETGRSEPMTLDAALAKCRAINKANQDSTWSASHAYVEEAATVRHLPVNVK